MRGLCPHRGRTTYGLGHDRRILRKLRVPESQDGISRRLDPGIPRRVSRLVQIMHPAIQFDHELDLMAGEVGDRARDRGLSPKFQTTQLSVPQHGPKDRFCACHLGAKAA